MSATKIKADGLLYHFLQHELAEDDVWLFQSLAARLIVRLGIWISPDVYRQMPWLVPYARRDPASRGNKARGIPDQWVSPDSRGYARDDNSLLKGVPRSMTVTSTLGAYSERRLDSGFVAAHVWRMIDHGLLASRHPDTYSFVPNVLWLPVDVAKLTDREGSFAQQFIQALALKIYRPVAVDQRLSDLVAPVWDMLPVPSSVPPQSLPDPASLNYFVPPKSFYRSRGQKFAAVARALREPESAPKTVGSRYVPGLAAVPATARATLAQRLDTLAAPLADVIDE